MSEVAMDVAKLVDWLPKEDQIFALEFVKKLVQAWDPDFTKVTDEEARRIAHAETSGFLSDDEIDWNNLEVYAQ